MSGGRELGALKVAVERVEQGRADELGPDHQGRSLEAMLGVPQLCLRAGGRRGGPTALPQGRDVPGLLSPSAPIGVTGGAQRGATWPCLA